MQQYPQVRTIIPYLDREEIDGELVRVMRFRLVSRYAPKHLTPKGSRSPKALHVQVSRQRQREREEAHAGYALQDYAMVNTDLWAREQRGELDEERNRQQRGNKR